MANMGRALMSGLVQGFGKYANMQYDEKQKAEQAERDQELVKLQQQLKQESQRFEQSLEPAQYQTYEATGADGKTVKRTIKSSYDPKNGAMEETVGESVVAPKEPRAETDREFYQRDPDGYAKYKASGQRPLIGGAGDSDKVSFDEYNSWDQTRKDAYDRYKGRAAQSDEGAKDRKWVTTQTAVEMRDFSKKDPYEQKTLLQAAGIDPNDPDATKKYRNNLRDDLKTQMGIDLFEGSVRSGSESKAKDGVAPVIEKKPTDKPDANSAKSPYPEGSKLRGPDGKTYIVKDGVPVPYGS